jgi:glutamate carboxypeptidase
MSAGRNEPQFDAEEIFEGIRDWVLCESPTVHVPGVNAMMDKAEQALARVGATIERQPGRDGFADIVTGHIPGGRQGLWPRHLRHEGWHVHGLVCAGPAPARW